MTDGRGIFLRILSATAVFGLLTWWVAYLYAESVVSALSVFIGLLNGFTAFMWPTGAMLLFSTVVAVVLSSLFNSFGASG